jgi:aminoglycoside phosphotransferase (APT) family kinase protein
VREGFSFDVAALERWMTAHVDGFAGPMTVEQFRGGQSNPTYKLATAERAYVLRRKPVGKLLKGAHAVDREARVLIGLEKANFPVAHVYAVCTDEAVIGSWFYVMAMVEGRIFWDATLPEVDRSARSAYFDAMNAVMAALHQVDYAAVGLADYGRPGSYFARQIARWSKQYIEDKAAGRNPHMDWLIAWLPDHIPDDGDETTSSTATSASTT